MMETREMDRLHMKVANSVPDVVSGYNFKSLQMSRASALSIVYNSSVSRVDFTPLLSRMSSPRRIPRLPRTK
jgi:hypothetical protein